LQFVESVSVKRGKEEEEIAGTSFIQDRLSLSLGTQQEQEIFRILCIYGLQGRTGAIPNPILKPTPNRMGYLKAGAHLGREVSLK